MLKHSFLNTFLVFKILYYLGGNFMKKKKFRLLSAILCCLLVFLACNVKPSDIESIIEQHGNTPTPNPDKPNPNQPNPDKPEKDDGPGFEVGKRENPYLVDLKVNFYDEKGSLTPAVVEGFQPTVQTVKISGKAKTACIQMEFTTKADKVTSIDVENESIDKNVKKGFNSGKSLYKVGKVFLTHGTNEIKIKITSENGKKHKTYKVLVDYDMPKPKAKPTNTILDGRFCPAPGKGEFVWVIYGAGW